ncbi:MAG TPA: outer membrane lipoprotein carrier protein LolA [Vicinamibacterales bacterium]|jgi:outer membrane lipoprotein carrier protein|nr:outer membrane lipoprotein carrier protein LolA [Vicinamibacterales bacterium]
MVALRRLCLIALAAGAVARLGVSPDAAELTPAEWAQALQRKLDTIKDFSADFVHSYEGGVLHKRLTESGHLLVKKPGKMRWEYNAPDEKLFVSDGVKIYSYIPQDKQVIVATVPRGDQASTPALFLTGKGNLGRDFSVSAGQVPAGMPAGTRALKLVPRTLQPDYDWLVLAFDPSTLQIHGLVTEDAQGGTSSFSFTSLKENAGISDKAFTFKIPRGVDIVTTPSRD